MKLDEFLCSLSSKAPIPGGGGASALIGAVGVALCSMVANLTSGKKKYAEHQAEIDQILVRAKSSIERLSALIERDAEVFAPLSKAYSLPKDQPDRAAILEEALILACSVPLEIMDEISGIADVLETLLQKGAKLAVSDVGVAAAALRSAIEGAALNVFINTKLMTNRQSAQRANERAEALLSDVAPRCDKIYLRVKESLVTR